MPKEKRLLVAVWEAFKQSLRYEPRTSQFGDFKGEDILGNKYYELAARPEVGRRKPSRWFESKSKDLMQEVPPEWESWLRNRRDTPPSEEEIIRNRTIFEMKKQNAKQSEAKNDQKTAEPTKSHHSVKSRFPRFDDLETYPGQHDKDKD